MIFKTISCPPIDIPTTILMSALISNKIIGWYFNTAIQSVYEFYGQNKDSGKMKIAFYSVLNLGYGGGFEKWVEQVATILSTRGHQIIILTTKYGDDKNKSKKSVE